MAEQIIDLLINYGTHPDQWEEMKMAAGFAENNKPVTAEHIPAHIFQGRDEILAALGFDPLIAQATLVLEDDEIEDEPDPEEPGI